MSCPHCGVPAAAGASRCAACGKPLAPAPPLDPPTVDIQATRLPGPDESPTFAATNAAALIPGQILAQRYRIMRFLGAGGMGAVYEAWDAELGIALALKIVRHYTTGDPAATDALERRFKRELLLARQVTHKNVVRIYDLGEADGIKYITMSYVQGSNLRALIAREGKLPIRRALNIARQVASGLAAAHEAGIVHRDLKPANIMIDDEDDRALIMDFGIALSIAADTSTRPSTTRSGGIAGTLEYMAPEQATGAPVDHRCDIYAFGLIAYDILTGGSRIGGVVADPAMRLVPPLRSIVPQVPEALERIVDRCLEVDPAARYQTTAEVVAALSNLDEDGQPRRAPRRVGAGLMAAVAAALLVAVGLAWVFGRRAPVTTPPPVQEPVSVLIADFDNRANDPVFNETIEQALTIGVEGASFITAYQRRDAQRLAAQLARDGKLDENTARLISVREGIKFVIAGSIQKGSDGYIVEGRLIDPAVGKTLRTATVRANTRADVLQAVGTLAGEIRSDLGDTTPESARLAAAETFTTASLDAVRDYTMAQNLANNSRDEEAIEYYRRAVQADPSFGRAYSGWAVSLFKLGRNEEAAELWKKALSLIDRMTERERYRTLGTYYLAVARNYQEAIKNYSELVKLYPADRAGHNNLAVAYFSTLNFPKALEEGRRAVEIYKGSFKFRNNSALYAMYAGDFDTAVTIARQLLAEDARFPDAYLPLAISLLAKGDRAGAREAYERMARTPAPGASVSAMGLADLAMYEGRFADAVKILDAAVVEDERTRNTVGRASKYVALAEAFEALGERAQALEAARKALGVTRQESVAVPMARVLIRGGRTAEANALAADLGRQLQTQTRAHGKIIEGEIALHQGRAPEAVEAFRAAGGLLDLWLVHFDLGVAHVAAGQYAEALKELETCVKRRGEATALFLDDVPSFRYLAVLSYWLGRAHEGLGAKSAATGHYKTFIAVRPEGLNDPLAADARRRLGP